MNKSASKWHRAELVLTDDSQLDNDFKDWYSTQPQIKKVYEEVPQPQLKMYMNEESESPEEVLFAAAVPLGMVKNILEEKSLLRDANEEL